MPCSASAVVSDAGVVVSGAGAGAVLSGVVVPVGPLEVVPVEPPPNGTPLVAGAVDAEAAGGETGGVLVVAGALVGTEADVVLAAKANGSRSAASRTAWHSSAPLVALSRPSIEGGRSRPLPNAAANGELVMATDGSTAPVAPAAPVGPVVAVAA